MNHLEFAALESAMLDETPWDRWIDSLEATCGIDLDGDQNRDGYTLDSCYDWFTSGVTVAEAAARIAAARAQKSGAGQ